MDQASRAEPIGWPQSRLTASAGAKPVCLPHGGAGRPCGRLVIPGAYHSLIVKHDTLPDCLELTAWTQHDDGSVDEIMGLRHKTLPVMSVQYHPEAAAGPRDGQYLFGRFRQLIGEAAGA